MFKIAIILVTFVSLFTGCSTNPAQHDNNPYSENQREVTLITGGCGYEIGDIVLLDTQKEPELGDVVQYDANINNSYCKAFGPGVHLAKIIGLPGDNVGFTKAGYQANGYVITFKYKGIISVIWGTDIYEDVAGMNLVVPQEEFLADRGVGLECTGETNTTGNSVGFTRFTIKRGAINGVIVEKLGHDEEFAEHQKHIVY